MKKSIPIAYTTLIYLFFYIPILVLIVYSFNSASYSLVWKSFSLQWYNELFTDKDLWAAVWHSLVLGVTAATAAMSIGGLIAITLYRYQFSGRHLLHGIIFILILSPEIVMGISLLLLFSLTHFPLGFWTLLLSHTTFCIPFVAVTVYSRIISFDKYIFEAAKDLGARDSVIFTRIILPMLWPALLAGWLLSFTLSLDDVITSYFVAGPEYEILPLKIYSLVRLGVKPEINALCTVTFTFTLLLVMLSHWAMRKKP